MGLAFLSLAKGGGSLIRLPRAKLLAGEKKKKI
jgi:hypothetical protein